MTPIFERRKDFRQSVNASLIYRINISGTPYRANKLDHNDNGISFKSNLDLKPGTIVYIRLENCSPNCAGGKACETCRTAALATIRWCRQLEDDGMESYLAGVKYLEYWFG